VFAHLSMPIAAFFARNRSFASNHGSPKSVPHESAPANCGFC
jgi:hypothetical protein